VILVDQAAESVAAADFACECSVLPLVGLGRPELESTMRSVPVVVIDVDAQDALEVPAVEDEQPVQTLGAAQSARSAPRSRSPLVLAPVS